MIPPYDLLIEPPAHQQRKRLPGHVRQRIKRAIDKLAQDPRPHNSQELDTSGLGVPAHIEIRRIRIDKWRLIYAVNDREKWVWVWGVRKRPPYDYEDLAELVRSI
jgi:mRNA-degrading endonuclease RelE of RelBE toxin-antitoxin system